MIRIIIIVLQEYIRFYDIYRNTYFFSYTYLITRRFNGVLLNVVFFVLIYFNLLTIYQIKIEIHTINTRWQVFIPLLVVLITSLIKSWGFFSKRVNLRSIIKDLRSSDIKDLPLIEVVTQLLLHSKPTIAHIPNVAIYFLELRFKVV